MSDWKQRRRELIDAQKAIFANQDREETAGIREETDEYLRLHRDYYDLAARQPWWVRFGTWQIALTEHAQEVFR